MTANQEAQACLEEQGIVWGYYKPRHTHAWNMLVLARRAFDSLEDDGSFACEYCWENFIVRLWLYRTTVNTLSKIDYVANEIRQALEVFDRRFIVDGDNALRAIRNMLEHFDEYADDKGRGPATRNGELDPWREVSSDRFERGRFSICRTTAYSAAIDLRSAATSISKRFTEHYKAMRKGQPETRRFGKSPLQLEPMASSPLRLQAYARSATGVGAEEHDAPVLQRRLNSIQVRGEDSPRPVSKRRMVEAATPDRSASSRTLMPRAARAILTSLHPVVPAKAGIQRVELCQAKSHWLPRLKLGPGFRRDDRY